MNGRLYRKKPVVVEAVRFHYNAKSIEEIKNFCGKSFKKHGKNRHPGAIGWAWIGTLEDGEAGEAKHVATEGDWIIKGVNGEFYPCKPDIFEKTYEMVSD